MDEGVIAAYDYALPDAAIAQHPVEPRDASRLLQLAADGSLRHGSFRDLPSLLQAGDVLVVNETRVIKARLRGSILDANGSLGRAVEMMLLGPIEVSGRASFFGRPQRSLSPGTKIWVAAARHRDTLLVEVVAPGVLRFPDGLAYGDILERWGEMPLPPYVLPPAGLNVEEAYQPIFARVAGSIAAPTASLHFSDRIIERVRDRGVEIVRILLAVGLGTFAPVRVSHLDDHAMHEECYSISAEAAATIQAARARGGRVVAVGTTVVRALESAASETGELRVGDQTTRLFIRPGFPFRVVDRLITNFHVPRSTLLVLVSAFAGREAILQAYRAALDEGYRFLSFGDAMLIDRREECASVGREH